MKFLPIVERELRVASRRPGTHRIRLSAAAVALLIGGWILLLPHYSSPTRLGMSFFVSLAIFTLTNSVLTGVRVTADALSEEKREGTLGLLFLTDLRGYDIVLGKLVATSINAVYGMLAVFPIMAIPLLLGGVSPAEFFRVLTCSLNNLFFSLAVGMYASAVCRDERRSMTLASLLIFFFTMGLPVLGILANEWLELGLPSAFQFVIFFLPSPGFASVAAFEDMRKWVLAGRVDYFLGSMAVVHLLGWAFLVRTCQVLPHKWQDKPATPAQEQRDRAWDTVARGGKSARQEWRQRLLEINPIFWLTSRDRLRPVWIWVTLGVFGVLWLCGYLEYDHNWLDQPIFVCTGLVMHTLLKFWIASEAGRQWATDRRSGALELLLATPLTVRDMVRGQWLSVGRQFLGPALVVLFVDLLFLWAFRQDESWTPVWVAGMVVFALDMVTLVWLAMWHGLATGNGNRATSTAVFYVMILPWVLFAGTMTALEISDVLRTFMTRHRSHEVLIVMGVWLVISVLVDLLLLGFARHRLYTRLRTLATQRPGRPGRDRGVAA